jgi:head-tail adaptor
MSIIPGDLRNNIIVKRLTTSKDAYGSTKESYSSLYNLRAKVKYNSGTKTVDNNEIFNSQNITFSLYYRSILTSDRIEFNSKNYRILFINEIGFREGLEIVTELIND